MGLSVAEELQPLLASQSCLAASPFGFGLLQMAGEAGPGWQHCCLGQDWLSAVRPEGLAWLQAVDCLSWGQAGVSVWQLSRRLVAY